MPYLNITNPFDPNKKEWIQISERNKTLKSQEQKITEDPGDFFASLRTGARIIDAGQLQQALNEAGITVSSDPEMVPNGVSISSAGILIALENELKLGDLIKVRQIIATLSAAARPTPAAPGSEKPVTRIAKGAVM